MALRALSSKESHNVPLVPAVLATSFGVLLGQIMPIHIATPPARAIVRTIQAALAACSNLYGNKVAQITALTVLRYILMVAGAVVIVHALIPAADPLTVALAFPAAQVAVNLPIPPAGLGLLEMTGTGL